MPLLAINLLPVNIPQNSCPKFHLLDGVSHYYSKLSHKELRHMLNLFFALREKCITNSFQPCDYTSSRPILQIGPEQTPQSRSPALHPSRSDETSSRQSSNWTRANAPVALTSASSFPLRRNIVAVNPPHWTRSNEPVALTSASSPSTKHDFFPAQTKHRRGQSSTLDQTKRLSRANQRFIEAYCVYKS